MSRAISDLGRRQCERRATCVAKMRTARVVCNTGCMGVRFTVAAPPAALVALILLTCSRPRPAQAQAPPMFSPWYVESLRDILKLEESDVARLEQRLAANPED